MSSLVSITEAAKMADVSRATIYNDINDGKISVTTVGKNKKRIDASELARVYPDTIKVQISNGGDDVIDVENRQERQPDVTKLVGGSVAVLTERLEKEKLRVAQLESELMREREERQREREQNELFHGYFKEQINTQNDSIKAVTKLLEDNRAGGKVPDDQRMKKLETAYRRQQKELRSYKEKTLLQRLFNN